MKSHLTFSLITVTYNAEGSLPATLKSVECQDYQAIEHIIVDGGSNDGTLALVDDYQQSMIECEGKTVKYISENDNGIYDAMNKGIAMATGDYVCFLNAGDSLHTADTLTKLANIIKEDETARKTLPAVVYGDTDIVNGKRKFLYKRRLSPPKKLSWKSFRNGMLVCHQSFYVEREIAALFSYNLDYRHSADFDWCIRVMKYADANKKMLLNSHLVLTDYLEEGHTTKFHKASLCERFTIMCKYYGYVSTMVYHLWFFARNLAK